MKALHVLMAVIWLLFGLTATAHAMPQGDAPQGDLSACHQMPHNKALAPLPDASPMPCCSQPAALPALTFVFPDLIASPLRHEPEVIATLTGIFPPQDPRPPQTI